MPTTAKLTFVSLDKNSRVLTVKDTTEPNSDDYDKVIIRVGRVNTSEFVEIEQTPHNINTKLPSFTDILSGKDIPINSYVLGITEVGGGLEAFSDGILDINMYKIENILYTFPVVEGQNFIVGTGLDALYAYDEISVGAKRYTINKSLPHNGGTVLYLTKDIEESADDFKPVVQSNLKVFNSMGAERFLSTNSLVIFRACDSGTGTPLIGAVNKISAYIIGAEKAFEAKDYRGADIILCNITNQVIQKECAC